MVALVDTNVLVYRYDPEFPEKQRIATELLREGIVEGPLYLPHQAILEFVAAVTRPRGKSGALPPLLDVVLAHREAEELLLQHVVLYPTEEVIRAALRGAAAYGLSWWDAHLLAYAEFYGIPQLLSEDFEHGRRYGSVRVVNPFIARAETVHEARSARYG